MGWDIFVEMSASWPRGMGGLDTDPHRGAQLLAYWSTDADGLDWLKAMVSAGRASALPDSRHPLLFSAPAADLLPLLTPAGLARLDPRLAVAVDASSFFHSYRVTLRPEAIAACRGDAVLTVEAWDRGQATPRPQAGQVHGAVPDRGPALVDRSAG